MKTQPDTLLSSQGMVYRGCRLTTQWLLGCQSCSDWVQHHFLAQSLCWMNTTMLLPAAMTPLKADQASQPGWPGCFTEGTSTCTSTIHTLVKLLHYPGFPWPYMWPVERGHSSNCSKVYVTHLHHRKLLTSETQQ